MGRVVVMVRLPQFACSPPKAIALRTRSARNCWEVCTIFFLVYYWGMNKKVLAIFAHPDDEAFGPGGTLAILASEGEVNLICVTDGGDPRRAEELTASAKILGVRQVYFLGNKDGSLCNSLYHEIAGKIEKYVEDLRPEILLTYEPRGVSGHLDHVAVSMVVSYVFRKLKFLRELWYFCEMERKICRVFWDQYFIFFPKGYKKEEVDVMMDTSQVYLTQIKAMMAHKTQRKDALNLIALRALLPKEEYFLVEKR
jgi:LmbE family N-acetylglucosaminyl deacetylase